MAVIIRTIILCFAFFVGTVVYAQGNLEESHREDNVTSEDSQEKVADTAASAAAENDDVTAEVFKALSQLRETIETARKESEDVLADIPAGQLTYKDKIKERFTTVINGICSELKKLKPGSDLDKAISNLIGVAEYQIKELRILGDEYDDIIKGWEELRTELKTISFQLKENRELLYDQLTEIVRKEQQLIRLLALRAVCEMKHPSAVSEMVAALNNVREKLAKWTEDAQWTITHFGPNFDARNAPQ